MEAGKEGETRIKRDCQSVCVYKKGRRRINLIVSLFARSCNNNSSSSKEGESARKANWISKQKNFRGRLLA